jgi:hypothetical protein
MRHSPGHSRPRQRRSSAARWREPRPRPRRLTGACAETGTLACTLAPPAMPYAPESPRRNGYARARPALRWDAGCLPQCKGLAETGTPHHCATPFRGQSAISRHPHDAQARRNGYALPKTCPSWHRVVPPPPRKHFIDVTLQRRNGYAPFFFADHLRQSKHAAMTQKRVRRAPTSAIPSAAAERSRLVRRP